MPTADRGLSVSELTTQAGSFTLGPVSLEIPPDRVLVVLGPSGAGKTMLLETIAGLRPQQSGRISLAGTDISGLAPERRRIGLVFQDAALFPHLSVQDNIRFGPRATRVAARDGSGELLRQLGIEHLADRSPRSLSGGERQRVALARALAIQPGLLLLDEPLSALDQPTREDMRTLLQQLLTQLEIPAAHVTHDRDEAMSIGDDLAVIVGGQLRQTGPAAKVAAEPAGPDAARLLGWSELGHGTAANGTARIGQLVFGDAAAAGLHGHVQAFYRPEDVQLSPAAAATPAGASLTAHVERILPTRPLARIILGSDPPIAALVLHREIGRLRLTAGSPVQVNLPPDSVRVFQTG
ncbi:MAG TPA: ABC transporter ATP-binding protein [Streptosporangiaceae bacterium]|nr:ABC transporter ATP-binding protein [Streptosporangiaceae bacterium]